MKIIFLVSSLNSGGAERVASLLSNEWASRGEKITLILTYSGRGECFYSLSDQVELIYLADLVGDGGRSLISYLKRYLVLRRFIADRKPDLVLSFLTNVNVSAILASLGLKIPIVVSERIHPALYNPGLIWRICRKLFYPLADLVVMQTSEGMDWLKNNIPRAKGLCIPNPVVSPLPLVSPILKVDSVIREGRRFVLAVGRLDYQKGFDLLISAFSSVLQNSDQWDLVILGDGSERDNLTNIIFELGLEDRVFLPGRAGNIGEWYQRADIYVMSSRYEGFPNTLAEAMAYGCPVISYDCDTGPRDMIRNNINGCLVTPVGCIPALAEALSTLIFDGDMRFSIGKHAKEIGERYSMTAIVNYWDRAFQSVLFESEK